MKKPPSEKKPSVKARRSVVEGVEALFVAAMDRIISICPPHMRVAVVIYHPERGPLIIGNCCASCTGALVHMASDIVGDPRGEDEEERGSASIH